MTNEQIIRMARETGLWPGVTDVFQKELELFTALIAEATGIEQQREIMRLKAIIEEQANGAQNLVLAEREACAKVCEEFGVWRDTSGVDCAAAIRARSEK